jgi:protein tyrosine/serine phosphatase
MQTTILDRTIDLEGCGNFRDLGGYETNDGRRTRWRRLFRSDSLHWLTSADFATLRAHEIHLVAGFDLRTARELEKTGSGLMPDHGVEHRHVPFIIDLPGLQNGVFDEEARKRLSELAFATGEVAAERYLDMFDEAGACFAALFESLADEASYPAAIFCAAGKDRTGMVAAVLLRALGVSDEQVVDDFALTLPITEERFEARAKVLDWPIDRRGLDPARFQAKHETMACFLEAFDRRYGSVEAYLEAQGVTDETLTRVRDHLLER